MQDTKTLQTLESACTFLLNSLGIPMSYNRHILRIAEIKIADIFSSGKCEGPGAVPFGFLLGGTIVNNIKGAGWDTSKMNETKSVFDLRVTIQNDATTQHLYPLISVIKYIKNNENRITSIYDTIEFLSEHSQEDIEHMKTDEEGWIHFKSGFAFRGIKIDKNFKI